MGRSIRLPYAQAAQQGFRSSLQLIEHQMVATKSLQSWPLRPALKGAPMDVIYHSEIGTPLTMTEVMNHHHASLIEIVNKTGSLFQGLGSHESYQSAVEIDRRIRLLSLSR